MKVEIHYELYFPAQPGEKIQTMTESSVINIPKYVEPQEMWVVRDTTGEMNIILSDFQPDHPKWPGKVKGWPLPTLAYRRERADIVIRATQSDIKAVEDLFNGMKNKPNETAKEMWQFSEKYNRSSIEGYAGYTDKNYQNSLIRHLGESLAEGKKTMKSLEANRP